MKKKTKTKLENKWLNLPLHHIDACIVMEVFMEDKEYESCKDYLNRIGYKYRSNVSIFTLGEILMGIIKKFEEETDRQESFLFVNQLVDKRKIDFSSPQFKTYRIVEKIKSVETRAEPMDALNLATAITENARVFVTLDGKLVGNKKLESAFGTKIKHPCEL
ncbi:hypothetical protein BEH94_07530 [Candidatus Altiarchaeales archaeon WOR_SM1_SCG]|nr:hypothetical protein BEH94_07530 [Candidatus Altiarchaeales archaeon WOR_SM1_SCG]